MTHPLFHIKTLREKTRFETDTIIPMIMASGSISGSFDISKDFHTKELAYTVMLGHPLSDHEILIDRTGVHFGSNHISGSDMNQWVNLMMVAQQIQYAITQMTDEQLKEIKDLDDKYWVDGDN